MKIFYPIILLCLLNLEALAQNQFTPKPDPMQKVVMGQGKVSKKEYDEFWQYLEASDPKTKREIITSMRKTYLPMQQYQKESWSCAKQAWNLRKKVPCPKADEVAANFKKVNGSEFAPQIVQMSQALIEGAAKRKPASLMKDVPAIPLTKESIIESEVFFKNSLDRLDQVLRAEYKN